MAEYGDKFSSDDFPKRCYAYFAGLRNEEQSWDFTLIVRGVSIRAHRVILAGAIPYFRDVFSERIEVSDIEPDILACLIDYAYTNEVIINKNNVWKLLDAPRKYGIKEVEKACFDFLMITEPETVMNDKKLKSRYHELELEGFVVVSDDDFSDCPETDSKHSAGKDPNVEKEEVLDDVSYAKDSAEERKKSLPELVPQDANFCSYKIRPIKRKRKKTDSSNEKIGSPCIFKLNATETYSFQRFDLLKKEWMTENPKTFLTFSGSAVPFQNKVYIFGLAPTLKYDPSDNSFESMSLILTTRDFFGATAFGNWIFICGGRLRNFAATNVVERFHPAADVWKKKNSMHIARFGLSVVTLDECIFAIGGICGDTVYSSVEKYYPNHDRWMSVPRMVHARWCAGAATLNDTIYVCGGKSLNEAISSCEMYDPNKNQWVEISSITSARCFFSLLPFQGKLYAIGGYSADEQDLHFFDVYDPQSEAWELGPSTDQGLVTSSAVVVPFVDACHGVSQPKVS